MTQNNNLFSSYYLINVVGTRFDLNPKREWIKAHVAQTINL